MAAPLRSVTVGLFGTEPDFVRSLGSALGKKGTESDLHFWNKKERDTAVTALAAATYPEKIVPLLQVASLCDLPVLVARPVDAAFGEMAIALQAQGKKGLLLLPDPATADRARALVKGRLVGWISLEASGDEALRRFRDLVLGWDVPRDAASPCTVVIDHAFAVRGVGTVALGFVRRGVLRVHDELRLAPLERTVLIRSIQRFDEDQAEAPPGSRVGVSLKGVEPDEIERGSLLTADERIVARPVVGVRPFRKVEFAKDPVEPGVRGYHLAAGPFVRPVVVRDAGAELEVEADRPMPIDPKETAYLTVLRGPGGLRVLGHGPLVQG